MWIPLVVILFGAAGNTIRYMMVEIMNFLKKRFMEREKRDGFSIKHMWPSLALLFTFGYCLNLMFSGFEQIIAIRNHMENRQALDFEADQPNILLSQTEPGDQVLYSSTMIMAYYFIRGAMQLGAVYYHPELKWTGRNHKLNTQTQAG
jgi:hypothetical protein